MHTKKFQVEKKGRRSWVVIRQMPHDPQYKLGSHIPSYGKVVAFEHVTQDGEPIIFEIEEAL